jgi:hypothetical protein
MDKKEEQPVPTAPVQSIDSEETMTPATPRDKIKAIYANPWSQIILISLICVCTQP